MSYHVATLRPRVHFMAPFLTTGTHATVSTPEGLKQSASHKMSVSTTTFRATKLNLISIESIPLCCQMTSGTPGAVVDVLLSHAVCGMVWTWDMATTLSRELRCDAFVGWPVGLPSACERERKEGTSPGKGASPGVLRVLH